MVMVMMMVMTTMMMIVICDQPNKRLTVHLEQLAISKLKLLCFKNPFKTVKKKLYF